MTGQVRAREYLRVSYDRSGRERSNTQQQEDHRRLWPDWHWADPYRDTTSASRYAKRARAGFPTLIADLRDDRFDAEILVMWESSRGSRKVGDWVELLDLAEKRGIRIAIQQHNRIYDPAIPRDRRTLLEDAVDSEYESAKTSGRIQRNTHSGAVAGRPHGKRLFGYRRTYDVRNGQLIGQEPDPAQAPIVRRVFNDYNSGISARAIARRLNDDGVRTNRGNGWTALMVHRMLANRSYVGRRTFHGEDFGPADWEPLVDQATFERAQKRREMVAWRRPKTSSRLCSTVARCGTCDGRMYVKRSNSGLFYICQTGYCSARRLERLDAYVTAMVLERLTRPDAEGALAGGDDGVSEAQARLDKLRAELDEVMALWQTRDPDGNRALSARAYAAMEADLIPAIAEAEREVRRGLVPIDIDIPAPEQVPTFWFDELTDEQRREVVEALIVSVTVRSVGRGNRGFDDGDYTEIDWR